MADLEPTTIPTAGRKIAILGYAPNVRLAPWQDRGFELWGLNDMPWTMPRIDVLFEMHKPDVIKAEGHWDRLATFPGPVFMQEHHDEIPTSVAYPWQMVFERYVIGGCERPFITCSASYMLPIAIEQPGVTQIDVFGVDMAQDTEFSHQRPSCEFFLGVAHGKGIKLTIQQSSDLLKTKFLYGLEQEDSTVFKNQLTERRKWLSDMMKQAESERQVAHEKALQYLGALSDIEHVMKRYSTF